MKKNCQGRALRVSATVAVALGLLLQGAVAYAAPSDGALFAPEPLQGPEVVDGINPTDAAVSAGEVPQADAPATAAATSGFAAGEETTIVRLVNQARIAACVPILNSNSAMNKVARNWSYKMATSGDFNHNPNYSDQIPEGWFGAGENIAAGYGTGQLMFDGWMNSPGHRSNILAPEYTDIGVGFIARQPGSYWIYSTYGTQVFAGYPKHSEGKFLDVRPFTKFFKEIDWMGAHGYSTGNKVPGCAREVTYKPKDTTSREAMAAFIYRMENAKYKGPKESPFTDVKPGDKFYNQITWMYKMGYTTGTKQKDGTLKYEPKNAVSREAMAAFLYRVAGKPALGASGTPFTDMRTGDPFYKEITWMHASGVSTGTKQPNGSVKYGPKEQVTREAMAAFIYRLKTR